MTGAAVDWIAVDWGTTRLRAWAVDADGGVVASGSSDAGMNSLSTEEFEPALLHLAESWLSGTGRVPVLVCGMAGAATGWCPAPYVSVPAAVADVAAGAVVPAVQDPRLNVRILPGLSQTAPPDVMRGEEVQIAGLISDDDDADGILCLPGTHAKWVRLVEGQVTRFTTFMTGELFALLAEHSILRLTIAPDGWDPTAFDAGVDDALGDPASLTAHLFALRAGSLVADLGGGATRARLSGLLIGCELASMRTELNGAPVRVIGDYGLCELYRRALTHLGCEAEILDGDAAVLAGLASLRRRMEFAE